MDAIKEIEKKLTNYENQYILENKLLKKELSLYKERENKYKSNIIELKNEINELNIIYYNDCEKYEFNYSKIKEEKEELNKDFLIMKNNFDLLKNELQKEISKNEILIDKYNKLSDLYEQKKKENFTHYKNAKKNKIESYNKNNSLENEKQKQKIKSYCNNAISIIIKWIENNFIYFYDLNNINNEELYNNNENLINIEKSDLFSFDKLKDTLLNAKENIDNYFYKMNLKLKEEKEGISNIEKKYIEINTFLKNVYHHLYEEINKEKYFDINNNIKNEYNDENYFYFSQIEYIIDNIFILLKKIQQSSFNKSLDKLVEDNILLNKEIENYKMKIVDLYKDNKVLLEKYKKSINIKEESKIELSNIYSDKNI